MNKADFANCFLEQEDLILRIISKYVNDYHMIQELCQQVFFQLYLNKDKVETDYAKPWLIHCCRNVICDHYRKMNHRKEIPLESVDELKHPVSIGEKFNQEIDDSIFIKQVFEKVKQENAEWFELLILSCIEGMSYTEISQKLCESEAALRTRMHRMRNFIRKMFHDEEFD